HQNARGIVPARVGGGSATAHFRHVDDIVVQQRGGMDELNDRGQGHVVALRVTAGAGAEQHQQGAYPLASRFDDVVADAFDQGDFGVELVCDILFEAGEILRYDLMDLLDDGLPGNRFGES